jgi:hypothetical protein
MLMNEIWKCFGRGLYSDQSAPPPDLLNSRLALEMIIAPTRGQTVSLKQIRPDGTSVMETVFAAYPDRLVLASPQRKAKLVLPNSNTDRLCLNIGGQAASRVDSDGPFRLNMGTGWSSRSVPDPSPFEVKLEFSAVFMLGLAHYDDMHCVLRDGTHHIGNNDFELQIDAATGRPVEYRLKPDTGDGMVVRARKQALKTELARLEEPLAQSVASYDSASPWKVRLDFAIDELLFAAERSHLQDGIESLRALHKLIHLWSPPALAELFEPAFRSLPEQDDAFRLPTQRAGWTIGTILEPGSQSRRLLIGRSILPVYRRFVPPTGALWPVGRDLALQWGAHHVTPGERLWTPELAVKVSPVALLTMQLLDQHLNRLLSPFVSRESLQCLELAAIGHGCEPFLTGDSWSSQWILSLATALRGLDESEQARVLAIFISDDELREALGNSLALLRTSPDEPVQKSVPRAIDQFWISVLQSKVLNESTSQGGQVLPAAYYLDDDLKNFLPGPEFKLSKQVQAIEEYKRRQQSKAPPEE